MKKLPSILVVIGNLAVGGAERHLLRVMPELNRRGFKVKIYVTNKRGILAASMEAAGVPVIDPQVTGLAKWGSLGKLLSYAVSMLKLVRFLRKEKPDIVHFYLPGAYLLGGVAAALARQRCLVMSRRITYTAIERKSLLFKFEKFMHRYLTCAQACSDKIKQELLDEGIAEERIGVIKNGIDIKPFARLMPKHEARLQLQLPPDCFVIVIVANLYQRKAHKDLLQALALIKNQLPSQWRLISLGRDGGELATLKKRSAELGLSNHIDWMGQSLGVLDYLAAADMGVLCSYEEGFSNALLECMAAGLSMVVTKVSGSEEAIIDKQNGFVVPVANPERLSAAILALAQDAALRKQFSLATKARAAKAFNLGGVIDQYTEFYQSLAATPVHAFHL